MSGDDLEPIEDEGLHYVVTKLPWRSLEFEHWLRVFDLIWLSTRFHPDGQVMRGGIPRHRVRGSRREEPRCAAVPGLPRNCYSERYLRSLVPYERDSLQIQPPVDLSHTEAVKRCVILCRTQRLQLNQSAQELHCDTRTSRRQQMCRCDRPRQPAIRSA